MATGLSTKTVADSDWVLEFCNIRSAWALTPNAGGKRKGEGVVIAHPDTGYTRHPELFEGERVLTEDGQKFFDEPGLTSEDPLRGPPFPLAVPGHGTGTSSVMMSGEANSVIGVAPLVKIVPYRVANGVILKDATDSNLANAINHAVKLKDREPSPIDVGVISISLGRPRLGVEQVIKNALAAARKAGIVICGAAGQLLPLLPNSIFRPAFPGCDANAIGVGACTVTYEELHGGFYGPDIDITAPGFDIWCASSERGNPTRYSVHQSWGTSHSAAIVAGACALWQAHWGRRWLIERYGADNILDLFRIALTCSADTRDDTWDTANRGAGVLDVEALLKLDLTKLSSERLLKLASEDSKTPLKESSMAVRLSAFHDE